MTRLKHTGLGCALLTLFVISSPMGPGVSAKELVYGSNQRDNHGVTAKALLPFFTAIAKETGGALTFKNVGNNQVVNIRTAGPGVTKRIIDAGLVLPVYHRKSYPNSNILFDMQAFESDSVAMAGAALETLLLHCPTCLAEWKKSKQVFLSNYSVSPFMIMCKDEITSVKELAGKKIRVSGATGRFAKVVRAVSVNMPPSDGVTAMQRGALDCAIGSISWLTGYGYIDVVKHVIDFPLGAVGMVGLMVFNRDAWTELSAQQRALILSKQPQLSAAATIHGYVKESERVRNLAIEKGLSFKPVDLDQAMNTHRQNELKFVPDFAARMGSDNPGQVVNAFMGVLPKWQNLSKDIDGEVPRFAAALKAQIYDGLDPGAL